MIQLSGDKAIVGPWVFARIGKFWHPAGREAIGLLRDGECIAGTVIEDFTGASAQMHVAVAHPNVPLRRLVVAAFNYVFVQQGCQQVLGFVNSSNRAALNFDVRLGFEAIAIVPKVWPDGDLVVLRMERKACRWIPAEYREAA